MSNQIDFSEHDRFSVVVVQGEVDLSWSAELRNAVLKALKESNDLLVDLSAVSYIDSSGIAALVEGLQTAKAQSKSFALVSVSGPARAVLELARLDQVFVIHDDLAAASSAAQ